MTEDLNALKLELAAIAKTLKANHLKMAKALAEGRTQEESYRLSGGKAKDGYAAASEMIKLNPKISQYAKFAKAIAVAESQSKLIATVEQKRKMLWEIANKAANLKVTVKEGHAIAGEIRDEDEPLEIFDASAAKTAVAAIAELNKMDGDLAAIKLDNRISGSLTVESLIEELTDGATK